MPSPHRPKANNFAYSLAAMIPPTAARVRIAKARSPRVLVAVAPGARGPGEMRSSPQQINAPIFLIGAGVGFGDLDSRRAAGRELRAVANDRHG